jgi:hypothetical protein
MLVVFAINSTGCACDGTVPSVPQVPEVPNSGLNKKPKLEPKVSPEPRKEAKQEKVADASLEHATEPEPDTDGGSSEPVSDGGGQDVLPEEASREKAPTEVFYKVRVTGMSGVSAEDLSSKYKQPGLSFTLNALKDDLRVKTLQVHLSKSLCTSIPMATYLKVSHLVLHESGEGPRDVYDAQIKLSASGLLSITFQTALSVQRSKLIHIGVHYHRVLVNYKRTCKIQHQLSFPVANLAKDSMGRVHKARHTVRNGRDGVVTVNFTGGLRAYASMQSQKYSGYKLIKSVKLCHQSDGVDGVSFGVFTFVNKGHSKLDDVALIAYDSAQWRYAESHDKDFHGQKTMVFVAFKQVLTQSNGCRHFGLYHSDKLMKGTKIHLQVNKVSCFGRYGDMPSSDCFLDAASQSALSINYTVK